MLYCQQFDFPIQLPGKYSSNVTVLTPHYCRPHTIFSERDATSSLICIYETCDVARIWQLLCASAAYGRCVTCSCTCHVQHCIVWQFERRRKSAALNFSMLFAMLDFKASDGSECCIPILVILLRLKFICRSSGTLFLFHLNGRCKHANQTKRKCYLGVETCSNSKSTSPCLITIPAFDRITRLYNSHLNFNRWTRLL